MSWGNENVWICLYFFSQTKKFKPEQICAWGGITDKPMWRLPCTYKALGSVKPSFFLTKEWTFLNHMSENEFRDCFARKWIQGRAKQSKLSWDDWTKFLSHKQLRTLQGSPPIPKKMRGESSPEANSSHHVRKECVDKEAVLVLCTFTLFYIWSFNVL